MNMKALICSAIQKRCIITFYYNGGYRSVEPYCCGATNSIGLLRAYQVRGHSESGTQGWKLFRMEKIQDLRMTDEPFEGKRAEYNPDDPAMKVIYCRIEH